jgi:hypothetical protein
MRQRNDELGCEFAPGHGRLAGKLWIGVISALVGGLAALGICQIFLMRRQRVDTAPPAPPIPRRRWRTMIFDREGISLALAVLGLVLTYGHLASELPTVAMRAASAVSDFYRSGPPTQTQVAIQRLEQKGEILIRI